MEESILTGTKKVLGLADDYTVFDEDVMLQINAAFSILHELGVGPAEGYHIESKDNTWDEFILLPGTEQSLHSIKNYVYLKVRLTFDPPTTSFQLDSMNKLASQLEWRINVAREYVAHPIEEVLP